MLIHIFKREKFYQGKKVSMNWFNTKTVTKKKERKESRFWLNVKTILLRYSTCNHKHCNTIYCVCVYIYIYIYTYIYTHTHRFLCSLIASIYLFLFRLVSVFNGISTFMDYLIPKLSFEKDHNVLFNPQLGG